MRQVRLQFLREKADSKSSLAIAYSKVYFDLTQVLRSIGPHDGQGPKSYIKIRRILKVISPKPK